jgi:mannose-6-phosphate isomerase
MVQPAAVREPLKFKPILQSRIWGGDGLQRVLGKGDPAMADLGESWELSDREGASTVVVSGGFAGRDLRDLFSSHARDILGEQYSPSLSAFPLLYKFIFAREHLSVQVHPGENSPLGEAKTECWYVLDAPEDATLIVGLTGGDGRESTLAALASKDCRKVLNKIPVKAGDTFFIQAGTVHAITAGLLLYEVQQNSDTTFRLYDWDRVDASGKGRALHLKESAQVIDFRRHDKHRIKPLAVALPTHREDYLTACRHFALVKFSQCRDDVHLPNRDRFRVITCVAGGGFELQWNGGAAGLGLGETALLPAACRDLRLRESGPGSQAVVSFIPDLAEEIIKPLRAAGHSDAAIRDLGGVDGLPGI